MGIGRLPRGIDSFPCEGQTGSHSGPEVRFEEIVRDFLELRFQPRSGHLSDSSDQGQE
jgi:hypothetical protein